MEYFTSNTKLLHSQITDIASPSGTTSTTANYYSMQNSYCPLTPAANLQDDRLPTTTPGFASCPPLLSQSLTAPTEHGHSLCTADKMIKRQTPDKQSTALGSSSTPVLRTGQQKCTRCKRWKTLEQFRSGDTNPQLFVGCLECRETAKKYGQSEFGKATRRAYNQTAKAKETRRKYAQSEKGKESRKKYAQTKSAKETRKKYNQSEKAKAARRKRALVKSGRVQEANKGKGQVKENNSTEMAPGFTEHITFNPSQEISNEKMNPMERAFWQTVTRTMYDQARRYNNNDLDEHDKFEVDIQLKYRRTR